MTFALVMVQISLCMFQWAVNQWFVARGTRISLGLVSPDPWSTDLERWRLRGLLLENASRAVMFNRVMSPLLVASALAIGYTLGR